MGRLTEWTCLDSLHNLPINLYLYLISSPWLSSLNSTLTHKISYIYDPERTCFPKGNEEIKSPNSIHRTLHLHSKDKNT
jgi:hypothetical protein